MLFAKSAKCRGCGGSAPAVKHQPAVPCCRKDKDNRQELWARDNSIADWGFRGIHEQAVVKPVPSHGSGQALSLSKGRSRDSCAGIPHIYSASPGSGRQESTYEPAPVTLTRSCKSPAGKDIETTNATNPPARPSAATKSVLAPRRKERQEDRTLVYLPLRSWRLCARHNSLGPNGLRYAPARIFARRQDLNK